MIDARRMEVFSARYDYLLNELSPPQAIILDDAIIKNLNADKKLVFCGNGSKKLQNFIPESLSRFKTILSNASYLAILAFEKFDTEQFADLAYTEPMYIKEFYTLSTGNS